MSHPRDGNPFSNRTADPPVSQPGQHVESDSGREGMLNPSVEQDKVDLMVSMSQV